MNVDTRLVMVGLTTPGRQQQRLALRAAGEALRNGCSVDGALAAASQTGSFTGTMRSNLVFMLDAVGFQLLLSLDATAGLWTQEGGRLEDSTSAVLHAVFVLTMARTGADPTRK